MASSKLSNKEKLMSNFMHDNTSHRLIKITIASAIYFTSLNASAAPPAPALNIKPHKLLASDGVANDSFAYNVALSSNTAVIGAHNTDDKIRGKDTGAAYIFTYDGQKWIEQAKLTASDSAPNDTLGGKVAISGNTVIVGAMRDDHETKGMNSGSSYVFVRQGDHWHQQAKLTADDGSQGDSFGWSIAVQGNTAIIGAPYDDDNGENSGSVYIFKRSGNTWQQQGKITAQDATQGDLFGISVALSDNTLIVGADLHAEKGLKAGAAYVFIRQDNKWVQQTKLTASDGAPGDIFGVRVALDNDTALISARRDDDDVMGVDAGSAYIFTRSGTTWHQQMKLTAPDGAADDRFGRSVALNGNIALISAMFQDHHGKKSGSAYVFKREKNIWRLHNQLTAHDGAAGDVFGWNVALFNKTALISANRDDDKGEDSGSAYVFELK